MRRGGRVERVRPPGADYDIQILGARPTPLRDLYHALLRQSWGVTFLVIAAVYLGSNALFALGFLAVGGVSGGGDGGFAGAFFFSVQTMGTIGYGAAAPTSTAANLLVVFESLYGLILTALCTGLVFARFSRSTARVVFSRRVTIGALDGVPTLTFRIGNERGNQIIDAQIRVTLARTDTTAEGHVLYRNLDLKLVRDRLLSLSRSWSVMHTLDAQSPLFGVTAERFVAQECELQVMVLGTDDTTLQPIHARHHYYASDVAWDARQADVLSVGEDGGLILDLRRFHDVEPVAPPPPPGPPAT